MTDAAAATPLPTAKELHHQNRISRHLATRATRARRLHERAALSTSTRPNVGLEPLAAGRCARLRLGHHADATAVCGMCLTRASVPSSQVTTRSWARTVFLVVQPRQYRCVRLLPSAACLQRSSPVLATLIAHTHPIHI